MSTKNSTNHTKQIDLYPFAKHNGMNWPASQVAVILPKDVSLFSNIRRITPMTALSANQPIQPGGEVVFELQSPNGHLKSVYIELILTELNSGNSKFNVYNLFQRIDLEVGGLLFHSFYPEELFYCQMLNRNALEHERIKVAEGLDANYVEEDPTIVQNTSRTFYLKIPVFSAMPDLRLLNCKPLLRCYFKNPVNVTYGTSPNLGITQMNLIIEQVNTPIMYSNIDKNFRYIDFTRFINPSITLNASNEYTFQLNTLYGYCGYLVFFLRQAGTGTNGLFWRTTVNNFTWELHDESNTIIAIEQNDLLNRHVINNLPADIINKGFYINTVLFALNGETIENSPSGGWQFTGRENLILRTNTSFVNGVYELYVMGAEYQHYCIKSDGSFTFTK